jgi:hypothetical protein
MVGKRLRGQSSSSRIILLTLSGHCGYGDPLRPARERVLQLILNLAGSSDWSWYFWHHGWHPSTGQGTRNRVDNLREEQ